MVDTTEVKKLLESEMKRFYRRKWAVKIADKTGFSSDYIRKYFKSDTPQALIAETAQTLIAEAKQSVKESIQRIQS